MLSSGDDITIVHMSAQQLELPAQNIPRIKSSKLQQGLTGSWEVAIDSRWLEKSLFLGGVAIDRSAIKALDGPTVMHIWVALMGFCLLIEKMERGLESCFSC